MQIIIKYVRNINVVDCHEDIILMNVCQFEPDYHLDRAEIIKLLLFHKINVNAKNYSNKTALMCYCGEIVQYAENDESYEEILELLIFNGADVFAKSNENKTAYDYVKNKNLLSDRMSQLLQGNTRMNCTKRAQ